MEIRIKPSIKNTLLLAAIGILVVGSSFTLSVFAEKSINSKEGIVMTEATPPISIQIKETSKGDVDNLPATLQRVKLPMEMNNEEASPFIKEAIKALENMDLSLSEEKYIISASYYEDTRSAIISWLPASWQNMSPFNNAKGTAYFVSFKNIDINTGTGTLSSIRTVEGEDIVIDSQDANTIRFRNIETLK